MRSAVLGTLIVTWFLAACTGGGAQEASPNATAGEAAVSCGATINVDTTLTADLSCPDGIALTIDTPNVTLDLNGHTLTGPGPGRRRWPLPDFDLAGVSVRADGVTVTNGTLRGFGIGVVADGASGLTIKDVTTSGGYYGVYLYSGSGHRVENSRIVENVYGLHLEQAAGNVVLDNELSRQTHHSPGGYGIYLHAANDNLIEGNSIQDNLNWGIWLSDSTNNTLVRNNVTGNDPQVSDDTGGNFWFDDELREGNFWGNYQGGDSNGDGIGDVPYQIGGPGRSLDRFPFVAADGWENRSGPTVNSPTQPPVAPSPARAYVALEDGSVVVVDPVKRTALDSWHFEPGNGALAVSLDGRTLYLATGTEGASEVLAIDTESGEIQQRFAVPGVHIIAATYDERALVVAGTDELFEIVLETGEMRALPGNAADAVAITPSWKHNLVFVTAGVEVEIVYLPDRHAPHRASLPTRALFAVDNRAGTRIFVAVANSDEILILDTELLETTDSVPLGDVAPENARVVPSPDGSLLYLLDTAASRISAIDLATKQVTASIEVSGQATAVAVSGDGETVVVTTSEGDGGRLVILNSALQPLDSIDLEAPPIGLVMPR